MNNTDITTDSGLQQVCTYWQEQLSLQNWNLKCFYGPAHKLRSRAAMIEYDRCHEYGRIFIRREEDRPPHDLFPHDAEYALVHELIHLRFHAIEGEKKLSEMVEDFHEAAINAVASALVNQRRMET